MYMYMYIIHSYSYPYKRIQQARIGHALEPHEPVAFIVPALDQATVGHTIYV